MELPLKVLHCISCHFGLERGLVWFARHESFVQILISFEYIKKGTDKNKRGGNVSIKKKREKEKEIKEKGKEKITKKKSLKRNGSSEGRSSSELES